MRSIGCVVALCALVALPLFARDVPTISTISPNTLKVQSGEWFVTLQGTHYLPTAGVNVIFSGPGGTYVLSPNASTDTNMVVWVPLEAVAVPGNYSVTVRVPNGAGTLTSNAVTLHIAGGWVLLHVPDLILAEAINLKGGPGAFDVTATSFESA